MAMIALAIAREETLIKWANMTLMAKCAFRNVKVYV
jgi:hypothetical protein